MDKSTYDNGTYYQATVPDTLDLKQLVKEGGC